MHIEEQPPPLAPRAENWREMVEIPPYSTIFDFRVGFPQPKYDIRVGLSPRKSHTRVDFRGDILVYFLVV